MGVEGREKYFVRTDDEAIGRKIYLYGEYDFRKFLRSVELLGPRAPGVIFDVGANVGSICIPAVKRGYMRAAVAIEPEPTNYALLSANVRWNGLSEEIRCLNLGLSDAPSEATMELVLSNNTGSFRIGEASAAKERIEDTPIVLRRFDDLNFSTNPKTDLLWLDIEGHEVHALRGMVGALESGTPVVLEFAPTRLRPFTDLAEVRGLFQGYRDFAVVSDKLPRWESVDGLGSLWTELVDRSGAQVDILVR